VAHDTYVSYRDAQCVTTTFIEEYVKKGLLIQKEPVSDKLLSRIRLGAPESRFMAIEMYEILEEQDIV